MNKLCPEGLPKRPKIAVIGYSGSGKSTLAEFLGERFSVPVLYVDTIQFLPGWVVREADEKLALMRSFLDENSENGWVIDGNYTKLEYERRLEEADLIIFMSFSRIACFIRAYRRSRDFKNKTRPSMTEGCDEKFDREFRRWILHDGRKRAIRKRYKSTVRTYAEKSVVIKNQRRIDRFKESVARLY